MSHPPPGTPSSSSASQSKKTELELGAPSLGPASEWRSRGYIPHRDRIGLIQSITFRLADSLPAEKRLALEEELRCLPEERRSLERRKRIEEWLDAGIGCCALRHPQVAQCVQEALLMFDRHRYKLIAWCIMPNHVHALIEPLVNLALIVKSWKSFTGRWALAKNAELELGVPGKSFWMREYWDRFIRDEKHFRSTIDYIHHNSVKSELCANPEDWPWSSVSHAEATHPRAHLGNADVHVGPPSPTNINPTLKSS